MRKLLVLLGLIGLGGLGYVAAKRLLAAEAVGFTSTPPSGPADLGPAYTAQVPPQADLPPGSYVAEGVAPVTPEGVAEATEPEPGPHGPGSALALEGGASPHPSYTIKGNTDSRKYHPEDSPYYARTVAEVWFKDEESAQAAGFVHWRTHAVD
jgi:hypothetical protein